jgi:hypothetical protein
MKNSKMINIQVSTYQALQKCLDIKANELGLDKISFNTLLMHWATKEIKKANENN